jgi:hypothetical protein
VTAGTNGSLIFSIWIRWYLVSDRQGSLDSPKPSGVTKAGLIGEQKHPDPGGRRTDDDEIVVHHVEALHALSFGHEFVFGGPVTKTTSASPRRERSALNLNDPEDCPGIVPRRRPPP